MLYVYDELERHKQSVRYTHEGQCDVKGDTGELFLCVDNIIYSL